MNPTLGAFDTVRPTIGTRAPNAGSSYAVGRRCPRFLNVLVLDH
jgi:hypothetical protein